MKHFYRSFLFLSAAALIGFTSCKKDKKTTLDESGASATISASSTNLQLVSANSANTAVVFSWSSANFGFTTPVAYTLQFDVSTAFSAPVAKTVGADILSKSYLVSDINTIATTLKLTAGTPGTIYARIKADVNQYTGIASAVPSGLSNVIPLTVTRY